MVLSLFGITLVASAGVAGVYEITKEPIAQAKRAAVELSLKNVLPEFDDNEVVSITVDDLPVEVYTATKDGQIVGYAVQSATKLGYSGLITMMVGIDPEGELLNINILSHNETPGLGSKMTDEENSLIKSVKGTPLTKIEGLKVKKDGGNVDALTGATISSRAYLDAIARAYVALVDNVLSGEGSKNE